LQALIVERTQSSIAPGRSRRRRWSKAQTDSDRIQYAFRRALSVHHADERKELLALLDKEKQRIAKAGESARTGHGQK